MNTRTDDDAILPVAIGTLLWLVALIVLLTRKSSLEANGIGWWISVAAVGLVSGLGGVAFLVHRRKRQRTREITSSGG